MAMRRELAPMSMAATRREVGDGDGADTGATLSVVSAVGETAAELSAIIGSANVAEVLDSAKGHAAVS